MSHAHASQQELLQRLQDKVQKLRKLEDTCRKQEKVIEKMEAVLQRLRKEKNKGEGPKCVDTSFIMVLVSISVNYLLKFLR